MLHVRCASITHKYILDQFTNSQKSRTTSIRCMRDDATFYRDIGDNEKAKVLDAAISISMETQERFNKNKAFIKLVGDAWSKEDELLKTVSNILNNKEHRFRKPGWKTRKDVNALLFDIKDMDLYEPIIKHIAGLVESLYPDRHDVNPESLLINLLLTKFADGFVAFNKETNTRRLREQREREFINKTMNSTELTEEEKESHIRWMMFLC